MTNKSLPERLWAEVFKEDGGNLLTIAGDYPLSKQDSTEYIRADLFDALTAERDALRAENERLTNNIVTIRQQRDIAVNKLQECRSGAAMGEPIGWIMRDLTISDISAWFFTMNKERLTLAEPADEWEVTPLYAAPDNINPYQKTAG